MNKLTILTKRVARGAAFVAFIVMAGAALAQAPGGKPSAAGRWQTIDDATGKPRAIVRIYEVNGAWQGDIEKVFYAEGEKKSGLCEKCPEPQRGKPVIGLTILWGLHTDSLGRGYQGGRILDPANATVYKARLWLDDSGNNLDVRGYIGFTGALGRSQRWQRVS